eukprot:TRINITY_DN5165_c0_g1_i1.p1 TRINITY_DN5165_c0_g1~~TRINITY_DN5165_c0_g1_i1.p1  ORF type:complete len:146 (+),score=25.09 TRINITY_DN5165_c0_g1_i1:100-537(+)
MEVQQMEVQQMRTTDVVLWVAVGYVVFKMISMLFGLLNRPRSLLEHAAQKLAPPWYERLALAATERVQRWRSRLTGYQPSHSAEDRAVLDAANDDEFWERLHAEIATPGTANAKRPAPVPSASKADATKTTSSKKSNKKSSKKDS